MKISMLFMFVFLFIFAFTHSKHKAIGVENNVEDDLKNLTQTVNSFFGFSSSFYFPKRIPRKKLTFNFVGGENVPFSTALDLGAGWERPFNPVIGWSYVQKDMSYIKQGKFDWTIPDNFIKQVPTQLNLLVTIHLNRIRPGTWQLNDDLLANFGKFVQKVVERYDGDGIDDMPGLKNPVKYWQIENEPVANTNGTGPNLDWHGFAQILETAYRAVKKADKTAKVLSAGVVDAPIEDAQLIFNNFWKPLIEKLSGRYIDIFDFHWYKSWHMSINFYNKIRATLDRNGFKQVPIWISETASSSLTPHGDDERYQAIDMVRRMIFPLSYGVKKVIWFSMIEGDPAYHFACRSVDNYGIVHDGYCNKDPGYGTKKLAYYTYKQMTHTLIGMDLTKIQTIINGTNDIYEYKMKSAKKEIYIVWWAYRNEESRKTILVNLPVSKNGKYTVLETVPHFANGQSISKNENNIFSSYDIMSKNNFLTFNLTKIPVYIELSSEIH